MKRTGLIRLGGLVAMVAGVAYAVQGLLVPPLVRLLLPKDAAQMKPAKLEEDIPPEAVIPGGRIIGDINSVFFVLLILSVMALIVAVHALQVESYGPSAVERIGLGALSVLPSIVGVTLLLVGYLGDTGGYASGACGLAPCGAEHTALRLGGGYRGSVGLGDSDADRAGIALVGGTGLDSRKSPHRTFLGTVARCPLGVGGIRRLSSSNTSDSAAFKGEVSNRETGNCENS